MFAGEELARRAEPRRHFVDDQQNAMLFCEFAHASQKARRMRQHARCPLHEGLDDHRAIVVGLLGELRFELLQRVVGSRVALGVMIGVGRIDEGGFEQQGVEDSVEGVDAAQRDRANRIAMVAVAQGEKPGARLPSVAEVLVGHFQCDFDGRGSAVGVEDFFQASRAESHESLCQFDTGWRGVSQQGRMSDAGELFADRVVDGGDLVAMQIAPERGKAIEIASARVVDEFKALASHNHSAGFVGGGFPGAHGRKRVPDRSLIALGPSGGRCRGSRVGVEGGHVG